MAKDREDAPARRRSSKPGSAAPADDSGAEREARSPSDEEIRMRAYEIYRERGEAPGSEMDDWLQAERERRGNRDGHQ